MEMEVEKMWHFKTTTVMPVISGGSDMFKKGTDKHINELSGSSSLWEIQKITWCRKDHFLGEDYQCDWKL